MARILVTGFSSGLGAAIFDALGDCGWDNSKAPLHDVWGYDHNHGDSILFPEESAYAEADVEVLINCAGVNKINWLQDVREEEWDHVMDTNVKGIFKMCQHFYPALKRNKGTIINIVSNAAHMPMRCSAAYNASKGAALILTKQLARELTPQGITVFSISPNKLANTGMSKDIDDQVMKTRGWTREHAQTYQLQGLLTGEETPPRMVAGLIAFLLQSKENHKYLSGCDLQYGA